MKLAETEYRVMNQIWADEGITAKDLAEALRQSIGWSKTTTYTVISRCIQKGYVRREDPKFHCHSTISRATVAEAETDALIGHYFGGHPEDLISGLLARGLVTSAQLQAICVPEEA